MQLQLHGCVLIVEENDDAPDPLVLFDEVAICSYFIATIVEHIRIASSVLYSCIIITIVCTG